MNIELANRLLQYRKNSGLSQEELAEKLEISRQSISKWERAEASPDTDNIIELAKIYNVTLDELLNVNQDIVKESATVESKDTKKVEVDEEVEMFENDKGETVQLNGSGIVVKSKDEEVSISFDGIYIKEKGKEKVNLKNSHIFSSNREKDKKLHKVKEILDSILVLSVICVYVLLCSFNVMEWSKFWVIFVYYPAASSLISSIMKKNPSSFAYPVLIAGVYVTIGMYLGQWHPWWALFVTVPLYYVLVKPFSKKTSIYYKDKNGEERCVEVNSDSIKIYDEE